MLKNKEILRNLEKVYSNKIFKIIGILTLVIYAFMFANTKVVSGYFEIINYALTFPQFLMLVFLPVILLSDVLILNLFDLRYELVMRYKNKRKYFIEILKNIFFSNTIIVSVSIMILLIIINFFAGANLSIFYLEKYGCYNIIYTIFIMIKTYILTFLFSFIFVMLYKLINKKIAIILMICLIGSTYVISYNLRQVVLFFETPIYFMSYFTDGILYSNFGLRIFSFIYIITIYSILLFIVYLRIINGKWDNEK